MRNIFDQYDLPENKLTHALVASLAEDKRLLRKFVRWILGAHAPKQRSFEILEQRLPGEAEVSEEEAKERGLPDAWIHDGNEWALLIESKIDAPVKTTQLERHLRIAAKRGFSNVHVLLLVVSVPKQALPDKVFCRTWSEVYVWLMQMSRESQWAKQASGYFEAADAKLESGTLTEFWGVYFDRDEPYSYGQAKRVLKLAMSELRRRRDLLDILHIDPAESGHPITGRDRTSVWDYLRFRKSKGTEPFTRFPHLSLDIEERRMIAALVMANGMRTEFRRNLIDPNFETFRKMMNEVAVELDEVVKKFDGATPWVGCVQRRYPKRMAEPIYDARIEYDPRTAILRNGATWKVKYQPQWVQATYDALANKRSNTQLSIGAVFPYSDATRRKEILHGIVQTWLACQPILDKLLGR